MSKQLPPKSLGPRVQLRRAREMAGWSQIELAERLGTIQGTVSHWETGETTPSPYFRQKLSHLLGRTLEELDLAAREPSSLQTPPRAEAIADPAIPPLPRLPLVGREQELTHLRTHLCNGQAVTLAMCGLPGVGKTTLACALAHDALIQTSFPDGVLWAGLGIHPDLQYHLVHWGTLLGLSLTELRFLHDGNRTKDLLLAVRGAIGTRRLLLILDDAWTVEDTLAFQKIAGARCATLITTRFPTLATSQGGDRLILHELTTEHSLDLLSLLAPHVVDREMDKVHTLIRAVGGLPLALTLIGNYLRLQETSGQARRIQAAIEQLSSLKTRFQLSEPRTIVDHHPSLPDEQSLSLDSVIGITDQQLNPSVRHALYALSVLPCKPESFSEEAALAVAACSIAALDELLDTGLLEAVGNERYTIHQTIADYARLHLDHQQPQERLIAYALTFLELHQLDYEVLAQESSTLLLALEAAYTLGKQQELVRGACGFAPFLLLCGNFSQAQLHLQRAHQAAFALSDPQGLISTYLHLGDLAGRQGDYAQSQILLQEGVTHARRQGDSEPLCALLSLFGRSLWKQGKYALATAYLQEGLLLARQMGHSRRICELLDMLGAVAERVGNYSQAEVYLQEGLSLARQIGEREEICRLTSGLGVIFAVRGEASEAEALLQEGLTIARQIGYREWACVFLTNLGDVVRATRHDFVQAEAFLQEGLTLAHMVGQHEWICGVLVNLTELEIDRGNYQQAKIYLEESAVEAAQLGVARLSVFVLFFRGILALLQEQIDEADGVFREMQQMIPNGDLELYAFLQYGQARLAASRGQLQQARFLGESSVAALQRVGHYQFHQVRQWLNALPSLA